MNNQDFSTKIFKALGHPIRYKIVKFLIDGPQCVCKLNENIEFSQANLSQHLKILKDSGVLKSEKVGLNMHYSIENDSIKELIYITDQLFKDYIKKLNNNYENS